MVCKMYIHTISFFFLDKFNNNLLWYYNTFALAQIGVYYS